MSDGQTHGETVPETFTQDPELVCRFTYHAPRPDQCERFKAIRQKALELAEMIDGFCPQSRERAFAHTNVEQAVMWANAAIARRE
jgi:hypothetical protein